MSITACTTTEQRGLPRPIDGDDDGTAQCDKGAVEFFLPGLLIGNSTVTESATAVFSVTLYPAAPFTVTVPYVTGDDSALSGSDYVTTSGVLTFTPGTTSKTISVTGNRRRQRPVAIMSFSLRRHEPTWLARRLFVIEPCIANARGRSPVSPAFRSGAAHWLCGSQ